MSDRDTLIKAIALQLQVKELLTQRKELIDALADLLSDPQSLGRQDDARRTLAAHERVPA